MWYVVGAAVITAVVATENSKSAGRAAKRANRTQQTALDQQAQAAQDRLDFDMQQYDDWTALYGDVQQNLSDYYNGQTPDSVSAVAVDQFRTQFKQAEESLNRKFAQLGVTSGAQAELAQDLELRGAESEARISNQAELQFRSEQANFVAGGRTNPNAPGVSSAYDNLGASYGTQAAAAGNQALAYSNQASEYEAQAVNAGLGAIEGAASYYRQQPQTTRPPATSGNPNTGFSPYITR